VTTIEALLADLEADAPVRRVLVGAFWTAMVLDTDPPRCGLALTLRGETHEAGPTVPQAGRLLERSGRDLAELLRSSSTLRASIGMTAFNALLEVNDHRTAIAARPGLYALDGAGVGSAARRRQCGVERLALLDLGSDVD